MIYQNLAIIITAILGVLYTFQEKNSSDPTKLTYNDPLVRWDDSIFPNDSDGSMVLTLNQKHIQNDNEFKFIMDRSYNISKNLKMNVTTFALFADFTDIVSTLPLFQGLARWESLEYIQIKLNNNSLKDDQIQGLHLLQNLNLKSFVIHLKYNKISNLTTFVPLSNLRVKNLSIFLEWNDLTSISELNLFKFDAQTPEQFSLDVSQNPIKPDSNQIQIPQNPMNVTSFYFTMNNVKNATMNGEFIADCLKNFQFYNIKNLRVDFSDNKSLFEYKLNVEEDKWFDANPRLSGFKYLGKMKNLEKLSLILKNTNVSPSAMIMIDRQFEMLLPNTTRHHVGV